ncbi:MAG: hypothetical protein HQK81_01680 [Desulfovibrionaceae bacterium]|nr:hypothetical protein [Desulfovibrionaceae bacterium]MBF0512755.1 hypothetical protein [Desulfovibrionaceae bacterium]
MADGQALKNQWISLIFLILGGVSIAGGVSAMGQGKPEGMESVDIGMVTLFMTLAYRSAKKRYIGAKPSKKLSFMYEFSLVILTICLVCLQNNLLNKMYYKPFAYVFVPVVALLFYAVMLIKSFKKHIKVETA